MYLYNNELTSSQAEAFAKGFTKFYAQRANTPKTIRV